MTEQEFLKLFKGHAKKMQKVVSYKEMIANLRNPMRMWSSHCPFFNSKAQEVGRKYEGTYFRVCLDGRIRQVDGTYESQQNYIDALLYWHDNSTPQLIKSMIEIVKELQERP